MVDPFVHNSSPIYLKQLVIHPKTWVVYEDASNIMNYEGFNIHFVACAHRKIISVPGLEVSVSPCPVFLGQQILDELDDQMPSAILLLGSLVDYLIQSYFWLW